MDLRLANRQLFGYLGSGEETLGHNDTLSTSLAHPSNQDTGVQPD